MNDEPLTSEPDDLHDRLIDRGLEEVLGGAGAPDLRERILAAAGVSSAASVTTPEDWTSTAGPARLEKRRINRVALAIAVCVMAVVGAGFILPALQSAREAARRSPERARASLRESQGQQAADREAQQLYWGGEVDPKKLRLGVPVISEPDADGRVNLNTADTTDGAGSSFALGWERQDESESGVAVTGPTPTPAAADAVGTEYQAVSGPRDPAADQFGERGFGGEFGGRGTYVEAEAVSELSIASTSQAGGRGGARLVGSGGNRGRGGRRSEVRPDGRIVEFSGGGGRGGRQAAGNGIALDVFPFSDGAPVEYPDAPVWQELSRRRSTRYASSDLARQAREAAEWDTLYQHESLSDVGYGDRKFKNVGGGDRYAEIVENAFLPISAATADNRLSTFSIDVDTASYANVRQFLMQGNQLPPPDAVRIEELVNYFDYDYAAPTDETPFAANVEVAACPWAPKHRLVRVGIKGREIARTQRPKSNLVFLVDVSGSMDDPQKLPLLVEGMRMLTRELGENDRVAIVVYASTEGLALDSTRGDRQDVILAALDRLSAGGSTAGGAGIQLAYSVAAQNFIAGGVNRVILCTDGDFNVGVTNVEALQQVAADKAKDTGVFLTVLGFGRGNLNDALMEAVADHGNGNYHYVDNRGEARKVLVEEMTGTLVTIAKDVKIQIEFNPGKVAGYRLIGYENRVLAAEDFNNDAKDAGEIGAGHTVTALYEVVPAGEAVGAPATDELKYGAVGSVEGTDEAGSFVNDSDELLTLKIRYKQPDGDESTKLEFPVTDGGQAFAAASDDYQFASAVAGFGMLLRGSQHKGDATFAGMLEIAESAIGDRDSQGYRQELVEMISQAKRLAGE